MRWLARILFGNRRKRRRDTAKVRVEAHREHLKRECAANLEASESFVEAARKTLRIHA